ncbi:MAG: hypothetical protein HYV33_06075 [Candidatus Kerfeldbacteria bacterium]|nr:hypothetical protein [Candidatus Kerfeldbacteria bacterium]
MQSISRHDILRRLRQTGLAEQVQASEVLQAVQLFLRSEFSQASQDIEPLYVRGQIIVIRCHQSAVAQRINERADELCAYVYQATGVTLAGVRFQL